MDNKKFEQATELKQRIHDLGFFRDYVKAIFLDSTINVDIIVSTPDKQSQEHRHYNSNSKS